MPRFSVIARLEKALSHMPGLTDCQSFLCNIVWAWSLTEISGTEGWDIFCEEGEDGEED